MPHKVNLDALIRRENFETIVEPSNTDAADEAPKLKIVELEETSFLYRLLRKPDFQRTTAHWTPEKVAGFIQSFLGGDLIPSIILWRSRTSGNIFVIDGAHRLSALLAWVHDDYGDGHMSTKFHEGHFAPEQIQTANETRRMINNAVGSYADIKHGKNPSPERSQYVSTIAAGGVTLQWVRGDASRAYRSFHTINTEQTPIGPLEVRLIRDRRCANAMATRSLIGAGTGQYFASTFSEHNKTEIKSVAKQIYDDLFTPPLETPIKTLDLPVAGRSYSSDTVGLVLDVIEFINRPKGSDSKRPKRRKASDKLAPTMDEDVDGSQTLQFLKNFRRISSRIAGPGQHSLGLHPAVYFYSATGNYQPTAFLAAVDLIEELLKRDGFNQFCVVRKTFEDLLVKHKVYINLIVRKYGSGYRALNALSRLYAHILTGLLNNKSEEEIIPSLGEDESLNFLGPIVDYDKGIRREFTKELKSKVFLKEALETAVVCAICGARVHRKSFTFDHIKNRREGGHGSEENAQISHPYCNSTFKDWLNSTGAKQVSAS